jgi:flagellar FliL protein
VVGVDLSGETGEAAPAAPRKRGAGLLIGAAVLALLLGGGGFFAVYSGLVELPLPGLGKAPGEQAGAAEGHGSAGDPAGVGHPGPEVAYVALEPLVLSLGPDSASRHLKVSLVVETAAGREAEVEAARPRIVDMLNVFLRAVDAREFEIPRSMERLRAQMLRRVQLVAPEGAVLDVLVQEFVLN